MDNEDRILQSAEKIFIRDGYNGARMKAIADDAKVNKAMLHYYFKSKDKLFQKIFLAKISFFLPKIGAIFFSDKGILEKLDAFVDAYMDLLIANPNIPAFIINTVNKYPDFIRVFPKDVLQGVISYIEVEVEAGRIKQVDARQFLISVIAMCVFPFAARPILRHVMSLEGELMDEFFVLRKKEVKTYIRAILEI